MSAAGAKRSDRAESPTPGTMDEPRRGEEARPQREILHRDAPRMTHRPWLVLAALWALLAAVTVVWVSVDRRPPEWDHANHLERALQCYRILAEPGHDRLREILEASSFYPPVAICAAGLLYFVFPVVPLTAQAVMLGFLGVALASVFVLGRRLWDAEAGLLAAFFLGTAPFVVFSLTNFQVDLPLAAMVALALHALVSTEGFARPGWSIGCGVILGLGMLTKPTFAGYVLPPLLWTLWQALRSRDRRRLGHLALALGIAGALALPWYGPRLVSFPLEILNRSFKQAAESGHAETLTGAALSFYPRVFQPQFGILAGLVFAWGVWTLRRDRQSRVFLWAATLVPLVMFSLIQNKNLRYTLPILPAAALVAAGGLRALPASWRRGVTAACLALGVLQVSMAAFAVPRPPWLPLFLTPVVFSHEPSPADWQHDRILADLARATGGRPATVAVVPNFNFLSVSTLRYEAARRGLPLRILRGWDGAPIGVDFAVLKTGSQGPSFAIEKSLRIMKAFAEDPYLGSAFPVIAEYPLPDGSRASLRARLVPPLRDVAPAEVARRLEEDPARFLAAYARDAVGLRLRVEYRPEALLRGEVDRVVIEADSALVGEASRRDLTLLPVRDVRLSVDRLLIHPQRLMERGSLELLDARAFRIERATVTEDDLRRFLRGQRAGAGVAVVFGDGAADVSVTRAGPTISARVRLLPAADGRPVALAAERVRVGPVPVPGPLVDWIVRHFDPTLRLRRLTIPVSVAAIHVRPGRLEVGGEDDQPSSGQR